LFSGNVDKTVFCRIELDEAKVKQFKDAIENIYWFEFFMGMFCFVSFTYRMIAHSRNVGSLHNFLFGHYSDMKDKINM